MSEQVIIISTKQDLVSALVELFGGHIGNMVTGSTQQNKQQGPEYVPKAEAKRMLTQKGYRVKSDKGLKDVIGSDVKVQKRGRELWYCAKDIEQFPNK